jgi:hypothetical protein
LRKHHFRPLPGLVAALSLAAGCASTANVDPGFSGQAFRNILVIGVAADYDGRALFEREMVSRIRAAGGSATAYYRVVGNNPPISRDDVVGAVRSGGFDAVLLTRVKDQQLTTSVKSGSTETRADTVGGSVFNLFRYDYQELNEPDIVDLKSTVVLTTELYSAADEQKVWTVDTTTRNQASIADLVENQADAIIARLKRARLLGN